MKVIITEANLKKFKIKSLEFEYLTLSIVSAIKFLELNIGMIMSTLYMA